MHLRIRTFGRQDYAALLRIKQTVDSTDSITVDELVCRDHQRPQNIRWCRWLAEIDGQVVGYAEIDQLIWSYHPDKYVAYIVVPDSVLSDNIYGALYAETMEFLQQQNALEVEISCLDEPKRVDFLMSRGFQERARYVESRHPVSNFDTSLLSCLTSQAQDMGYIFTTLPHLNKNDEQRLRQIHRIELMVFEDAPNLDRDIDRSFEHFLVVLERGGIIPEAYFVALYDSDPVGICYMVRASTDVLIIAIIGVVPEHRGHSLSTILQGMALNYAKEHGFREVRTRNEETNWAIRAVNRKLGFAQQPVKITFVRKFDPLVGDQMPHAKEIRSAITK